MANKKIKDLCATVGSYELHDGTIKKRYLKVGACFMYDNGSISIKLDKSFNPAGIEGDCWLSVFDQGKQEQKPATKKPYQAGSELASDEVPF